MENGAFLVEERAGALWVTFNRPEKMNPMDMMAKDRLRAVIARAKTERPVALVITGRGSAFCAGGDLEMLKRLLSEGATPDFKTLLAGAPEFLRSIEELPIPVIAGVNGLCVAGGMELICACDLVVAAESARFSDGHANFGLVPVGGSAHRLAARVGLSNAKRLLFTGEFVSAQDAYRMGLANWVVPDREFEATLEQICTTLGAKAPSVLERIKLVANHGSVSSPATAAEFELQVAMHHFESEVVQEGLRAFAEKRPPKFR